MTPQLGDLTPGLTAGVFLYCFQPLKHCVASWTRKLSEPVKIIGRKAPITTLAEAREFILKLSVARQGRNEWQYAAKLIIAAAEGGDVAAATRQLQFALMMSGKLRSEITRYITGLIETDFVLSVQFGRHVGAREKT